MAENSPSKRMATTTRKSPPYHPYFRGQGKNKSPNKQQSENSSFNHISDKNFFSFSGGSTSLFPSNNNGSQHQPSVRSAMSELSNILKQKVKHSHPQQQPQKVKPKEDFKIHCGDVGIIGSQRQVQGFIPVESSCTIGGEAGPGKLSVLSDIISMKNNKNNTKNLSQEGGFQRSTSFTYVPTGTVPSRPSLEPDDEEETPLKIGGMQWPIYNKQKIVHAKTFYPPSSSELSLLTTPEDVIALADTETETDTSFRIYEEAGSSPISGEVNDSCSYPHDSSLDLADRSKNSTRIPLSDISASSSVISCELVPSSEVLNDSGLSAMDDNCTFGLDMVNVSSNYYCHEKLNDFEEQEVEEVPKPRKFFKTWIPGRSASVTPRDEDSQQSFADEECSYNDEGSSSPLCIPSNSERPHSVKRNDSFNCSFNSSFNDNLANLGIDSFCSSGSERGILTEKVNPFFDFPEYSFDILNHWTEFERKVRPRWRFMDKQNDISQKMRTILIDWLVEVGAEYELHEATLFLAVSFIDRFLSKMAVSRGKLQLVGTAALFVASKYEEISPPTIKDFVYITDETYSKEQLLRMEKIMLNVLNFDLMAPTSYEFCKAFCSLLQLNSRAASLAMYLTELSLLDGPRFMNSLPSLIALAAVGLASYTVKNEFWNDQMANFTKHRRRDVERTAVHLYNCFYDAPVSQQAAVFEKYKAVKYCSVSLGMLPLKLPWNTQR